MESTLGPLLSLFERERAAQRAVVLGVLLETQGSTYRKPGALMLINCLGEYAGLLSGGCLEGDLGERATQVIESGLPALVTYELRNGEDLLWGLGLGCEGAMKILLLRAGPSNDWQPLTAFRTALASHTPTAAALVVDSQDPRSPAGTVILPGDDGESAAVHAALSQGIATGRVAWLEAHGPGSRLFVLPLALPPRLLLLGAGPDAAPIVEFAARLGWRVTLVDHRTAYARAAHFPAAERVLLARPESFSSELDLSLYAAAVVMSHHLPSDGAYLRVLCDSAIAYVGLLGPPLRRERLLADLGEDAQRLRARLRSPVGLQIGGRAPESIALSIVAEIHAFLHGYEEQAVGRLRR